MTASDATGSARGLMQYLPVVLPGASGDPKGRPLTLEDCYALALKQSETIAIDAELIKEAEAHFLQSFGTILPQVSFVLSDSRQNSHSTTSALGNTQQIDSHFVFKQTLFSGFKEFAGMAGSKMEQRQRENEKKRAEQLLFIDVADAFYLLLQQREDLKALEEIRQALSDRIVELKKREDVGRSRNSEVVNTESQLYNVEAEIESSKSQELIARELVEFLIGKPVVQIADPKDTPSSLLDEIAYTSKIDLRPDVKAAEDAWGLAKKQVAVARSDLFPTVSMEGDVYPHRNDPPDDQTWATILKVDVPIFEGTTTYGAIKGANAQARASELQFKLTKRLASQDIHDSYVRAKLSISQYQALDKALKAAQLNYSLQAQDYQYNLVNNLDVLTAIQNLANTRRNHIQSLYAKKRFYWELQAAIGEIGQEK